MSQEATHHLGQPSRFLLQAWRFTAAATFGITLVTAVRVLLSAPYARAVTQSSGSAAAVSRVTLIEVNGLVPSLIPLLFPVLMAALPLALGRRRVAASLSAAGAMGVFVLVAGFSVGQSFIVAFSLTCLLVALAVLEWMASRPSVRQTG